MKLIYILLYNDVYLRENHIGNYNNMTLLLVTFYVFLATLFVYAIENMDEELELTSKG